MRSRKPYPQERIDECNIFQKFRKPNDLRIIVPVIRINILSEQCHFPVTHFKKVTDFLKNRSGIPASFRSTYIWYDTICAHVIATPHYRNKEGDSVFIHSHW